MLTIILIPIALWCAWQIGRFIWAVHREMRGLDYDD